MHFLVNAANDDVIYVQAEARQDCKSPMYKCRQGIHDVHKVIHFSFCRVASNNEENTEWETLVLAAKEILAQHERGGKERANEY